MGRRSLGLALLLGLWGVGGCGTDDSEGGEKKPLVTQCEFEEIDSCRNDVDCGEGLGCRDSCCLPRCELASDCGAQGHCGDLGCVCDEGICLGLVCASDVGCSNGLSCIAGECVAPVALSEVAGCELAPLFGVVKEGEGFAFSIQALSSEGLPLRVQEGFSFESTDPARAVVTPGGEVIGGAVAGEVEIVATFGAGSCRATVLNQGPKAPDVLRVVVVDELTGLPIPDAMVQVETADVPVSRSTDEAGKVELPLSSLPAGARTLSAFHDDYAWITVVGVSGDDRLLPLRRLVPEDRAGGFRGRFGPASLFDPENVQAGLAGTSLPGNPIDISLPILAGPSRRTVVTIGEEREVDIPSGIVLGLGNTWFKEEYQALGLPGACDDESLSRLGRCGVRSAWGMAGGVPLLDLPLDQITEGSLEAGDLLAQLLPQFRRFRSAVVRDVSFELAPTKDGLPDPARMTPLDLQATQRLALRPTLLLPELPAFGESRLDGVIALGGADVPGRGLVPLGLTAGIDAEAGEVGDGLVNDPDGNSNGELPLRLAPQHGGVEGNPYVLLALAANFNALGDSDAGCTVGDRKGCTALAGLLERRGDLAFDETVDLRPRGFVGLASSAEWLPDIREFRPGATPSGAPDLFRLKLVGEGGRTWHVWFSPGTSVVRVPVPGGMETDRVASSRGSLQALRVGRDLDGVLGYGRAGLSSIGEEVEAFSSVDLPRQ